MKRVGGEHGRPAGKRSVLDYVAGVKQDYVDLKGCDLEKKERPCNIKRRETSSEASSTRRASEPASKPALVAAYTPGV